MELTKFTTRIPKSLKLKLERESKRSGVSIQSLTIKKLSRDDFEEEEKKVKEGRLLYEKLQIKARLEVKKALITGKLIKQNCEKCGSEKSYAHHDDYEKPLIVMWLCAKHHNARHKELQAQGKNTWSGMKKYGFTTYFK